MARTIVVVRADPFKRIVAPVRLQVAGNLTRDLERLVRAKPGRCGARALMEVDGVRLMVAAALDQPFDTPALRLRGCESTTGISVLFGGSMNSMTDCPIDRDAVLKRIVWLEGKTTEQAAAEILPMLDAGAKAALLDLAGSADISRDALAAVHMLEPAGLTRLGIAAREIIVKGA